MIKKRGSVLTLSGTPTNQTLLDAFVEMYRLAISELPRDVVEGLETGLKKETSTRAKGVLRMMLENIELVCDNTKPLCQDTGVPIMYVHYNAADYSQLQLKKLLEQATKRATKEVPLRDNALDILKEKSVGNHPIIHFEETTGKTRVELLLKGGGSENVSKVYKLPDLEVGAERDLAGIEQCIVDAVVKAQGRGCPPYIVAATVSSNIADATASAKELHIQKITSKNSEPKLAALEKRALKRINDLGIGPMGVGGNTTALAVKCSANYVHPASWFVGISVGCWSMRRVTLVLP